MQQYPNQEQPVPPQQQPGFPQPQPYYPQQPGFMPPPQPAPRKSNNLLWIIVLLLVSLVSCGVGYALHTPGPAVATTTNTAQTQSTQAPAQNAKPGTHHKVGEQVVADGLWQITVDKVRISSGSDVSQPASGKVYLLIDVSMKNISDKMQVASSIAMFDLRDKDGNTFTQTIVLNEPNPPNGNVETSAPIKGTLGYEVPKNVKNYTLSFITSLTDNSPDVWDISVS